MENQHSGELISAWKMPQTQQQRWVAYGNSPGMQVKVKNMKSTRDASS